MANLVTKYYNIHNAKQFIESLTEPASDNYYICFGKHTSYVGSDSTVETPVDTFNYRTMTVYDDMIFGKKVTSSDTQLVVTKTLWESGTVYDIYDDTVDLADETFFVAAQDGSNYNVYKCLFNADGAESTVMPTTTDTSNIIESDGYIWKYMYTISSANWTKFSSLNYMPVYSNTTVQAAATDRSIDVILIEYSGSYYNNHFSGEFEAGTQIISSNQFKLSGTASDFNDYYNECIIEFTSGAGKEYREITDYTVSGTTKIITIDTPIDNDLEVGDTYQIYPKVKIFGDGNESSNCLAWAIVDSTSSNTVSEIEILTSGLGYRQATAEVAANESVGVTDLASLRPIISPKNGHGYDPEKELIGNKVCISVKVTGDESNNIVATNDFRNVTLLKNPEFKEIKIEYIDTFNIFDIGETVYQYKPIQLIGSVDIDISTNASIITGTSTKFDNSVTANDYILVQNTTASFISQVTSINSNTELVVSSEASANMESANVFLANILAFGEVASYLSNSLTVTSVTNTFSVGDNIIGSNSYTTVTPTTVTNNGRNTNDLLTFQQTVRFDGTKSSVATFTEDEYVYESGTYNSEELRPIGRLFSYVDDTTDRLYLTNERNNFSSNATIIGNTSGAVFASIDKYNGDLIKDSGEIFYINNVEAITKTDVSNETIKIILQF